VSSNLIPTVISIIKSEQEDLITIEEAISLIEHELKLYKEGQK